LIEIASSVRKAACHAKVSFRRGPRTTAFAAAR
jgi:hypothetical protein